MGYTQWTVEGSAVINQVRGGDPDIVSGAVEGSGYAA